MKSEFIPVLQAVSHATFVKTLKKFLKSLPHYWRTTDIGHLQVPPKLLLKLLHFVRKFDFSISSSLRPCVMVRL
jgi:hypothetical protein